MKNLKLDKTAFSIGDFSIEEERLFWLSKSPQERIEAVEIMRQTVYGYDATAARLQRILEVIDLH